VTPDPLADALDQLAAARDELRTQTARLAGLPAMVSRALAEDAATLERLADLDRKVDALTRQPGRDAAHPTAGLEDWVERVYRPGYGHLAVLGPCWQEHQLCLYGLDILRDLWTALYDNPDPDADPGPELVSARAEYQARILPAIAAQLAAETTHCGHPTIASYPRAHP
jgi:hypothetical protein